MVPRIPAESTALAAYDAAGFKMIRVSRKQKNAIDKAWPAPENRIDLEAAEAWLEGGQNIGLQCGEQSRGLAVAECDSDLSRKLAGEFLPETLTAAKEGETTPAHFFYIAENAPYRKVKDVKQGEILSLKASEKGKGHYVVVEPSVHPEKGRYVFMGGFDADKITRISAEVLEMHVNRLGAAALIAEYLEAGGRHDYAMALTGFMGRNGETAETVLELLKSAWRVRDALTAKAERDLEGIVEDTFEKLTNNEPCSGGRTLNEMIGGPMASRLSRALGWDRADDSEGREIRALTHMGNAERLVAKYGEHIRYCYPWKCWLIWDGKRWKRDDSGKIVRRAKSTARDIFKEASYTDDEDKQKKITRWATASQHESNLSSMISLARSEPGVPVMPEELDSDPMLLTVENGTIDLRTGERREHRPGDLITKLAPVAYDLDAKAARFEQFLEEIFPGDPELQAFVSRFGGYTLTGDTSERCMAILHGGGRNGKSTLVELLRYVMGDYARTTSAETLLQKRSSGGANNEVAALAGARFVSAAEVEKNRRLAESKVKELTGSDTITARFLFAELFDFKPEFKLWLSTNNKPEITGTDDAIWDRIRLIPFEVRFEGENVDKDLGRKLRNEAPGVLAWLVRGCLDWQANGLAAPAAVMNATAEYRADMDTFADFLTDKCVVSADLEARRSEVYDAYIVWCRDNHEEALNNRKFNRVMRERGFKEGQITGGPDKGIKLWKGVGLLTDDPEPDPKPATGSGSEAEPATAQSVIDKRKSPDSGGTVAGVAAKNQSFAMKKPRVRKDSNKPATPATRYSDHECERWAWRDGQLLCNECALPHAAHLARKNTDDSG